MPKRIMEDEAFIMMLLPFAKKIVLFQGSPYYYRQHSQSIVAQSPIAFDRLLNFGDIINWYQQHQFLEKFPIPFYILYDTSVKNKYYLAYITKAKELLADLNLPQHLLEQNKLALYLANHTPQEFQEKHQKSRGLIKYYLRKIFHLS